MKILMIGDIYGRSGRDAVATHLPSLRARFSPDVVIANADNAAHGRGLNPATVKELYDLGIDLLTGGDHVWDNREMLTHLDRAPIVLRPLNFPNSTIGKGAHILSIGQKKLLAIHAMGRVFMEKQSDNPFHAIDAVLQKHVLGRDVQGIVVDFHAEASSEKNAFGWYCDGRVSAVVGTHTHVPTADARLLPKGTAYITDIGMSGDYNSIIGAEPTMPLQKFVHGYTIDRMQPASGVGTVCGVCLTLDPNTGFAIAIEPFQVGGVFGG